MKKSNELDELELNLLKKIGDYEPKVVKKGYNEFMGKPNLKNGTVFWTVKTDRFGKFDTMRQEDAIIISELIKIRNLLKRRGHK